MKVIFSRIIVLLLILSSLAYAEKIKKSFDVQPGGTLNLESDVGSIKLKTHSQNSVIVEVEKRARGYASDDEFVIEMSQSGNDVRVDGYFEDGSWSKRSRMRVEYFIIVPEEYNIDLHTSGGSISVDDLDGWAELNTSGGSIQLGNVSGKITAKTSGGSIQVQDCKNDAELKTSGGSINVGSVAGSVMAYTSGGSINAENVGGELDAKTSGGSIKVEDVGGTINAKTSGGSVRAAISKQPKGAGQLKTSGGDVVLYISDDIGLDVYASTSGGRVYTDFDVTVRGELKKNRLEGKINGGGPEYELRTSGGDIEILKR